MSCSEITHLPEVEMMGSKLKIVSWLGAGILVSAASLGRQVAGLSGAHPESLTAKLSEWKIELSQATVPAGPVTFTVMNQGSIPHAFEVQGHGTEQETKVIQPGSSATITLTLQPGSYEVYCPVGGDSHKKLGMETELKVMGRKEANAAPATDSTSTASETKARWIRVEGGGPVIQILPGPFPFADSAASVLTQFGAEQEMLKSQEQAGPYSNRVSRIAGRFTIGAWDRETEGDSVAGLAEFTTQDGARWKLVVDRVQTTDVPRHPRFGGVIMGLYYHGATGVHTPLVPTINSAVALWAYAHLYRNDALVTDSAMVHVMQLSQTRRDGDFALACWDCSRNPIEELQLQVTPPTGAPKFEAPGGVLFINWEKSRSTQSAG
jgi:plastocyanin